VVKMVAKAEGGCVSWPKLYEEMVMQFGPDELDDPMAALANLKQTGTVLEHHKSFIKLAHLMDDSENNLISLILSGLREDLRKKMRLDKLMTMVGAYKSACVSELIAITEKRVSKFQPYKNSRPLPLCFPSTGKVLATAAKKRRVTQLDRHH